VKTFNLCTYQIQFVLGLQYLFYPARILTGEQFTCSPKKVLGVPADLRFKVWEGEVINREEGVGREKPWGEGSGTRGRDERESRVWQVRREEEMGRERWVGGVLRHAHRGR